MSDIYANAVDSLRVGVEYFLKEPGYSSRKHAILALFHATELLLKEQLYRTNPILIYRNLDAKISEDSQTVGVKEALTRLDNLGVGIPPEPRKVIEKIQQRRNRIEHHRFDQREDDEQIISETLAFILFFADSVLRARLERDVPPETLRKIQGIVYDRRDLYWIAMQRLELWMASTWPEWDEEISDTPDEFEGTVDCPVCRQTYLVIDHEPSPFCFYCNTSIDASECEHCGVTFLVGQRSCSCEEE